MDVQCRSSATGPVEEKDMINRPSLFVVALALVSSAVIAQQQPKPEPTPNNNFQRQQD
jgi:hypothetical protein